MGVRPAHPFRDLWEFILVHRVVTRRLGCQRGPAGRPESMVRSQELYCFSLVG